MSDISLYTWVGLPLLIFFARVVDVSLGTLRIIFTARGWRYLAPLLGFVEVFIWIVVVSQITRQANNLLAYLAYASGFAAGNYVGIWIENRLAIGTLIIRLILPDEGDQATGLAATLHQAGYGVTRVAGAGANGPVQLIYTVIRRKDLASVSALIHQTHPRAFLTVEEVRSVAEGIFPPTRQKQMIAIGQRKGK
jgi:uncharacterized protein YebE (UPF0316 family)